ncbi:polysaccharide deacetylase family protein [Phenylobacterium sp.]|jgi:peptidoglycan/xylan/chitin deacetylase (PgdA/CDA1 family)|uniref:polysaccharide deacetylase family protein n=1 Tax=Phenylobacterium sp. TaxID=1871053 RepID=UPI002E321C8C|nr:polysaccharide deacetylase family protein [Phenylobacterium sp.]HEX4709801.1 polysaccharide deacetylase family protein [Phenylobacterium sp.]
MAAARRFPGRRIKGPRGLFTALVLALLAIAAPAAAEDVALTFDDLPTMSLTGSLDYTATTTRRLLAGLVRQRIRATGFVNENKLEATDRAQRIALLSRWLGAGMDLGNHSYSHLSLTSTPLADYIADVSKGEQVTRALLAARGREPRWYRHPYLETGPTLEVRQGFEAWLSQHGYRVAPVTMENSDWVFALPYDEAVLRGDAAQAEHVRQAYLAFTAQSVTWYRQAAMDLFGRRPSLVLLLHASRLNADCIDRLAELLRADGLKPVSLERAVADPAYATPDAYAGRDGDDWLERWARTLHKTLPWESSPEPPADIVAEDARLEPNDDPSAERTESGS